jgi:hypothetical protein
MDSKFVKILAFLMKLYIKTKNKIMKKNISLRNCEWLATQLIYNTKNKPNLTLLKINSLVTSNCSLFKVLNLKPMLFFIGVLLFTPFLYGQQTLFSYDTAGNQITTYVEINLVPSGKMANDTSLQNNPIYKDVKYFPNPVKSELYMEWEVIEENTLSSISIFNLEGILLNSYKEMNNIDNYILPFENYPQGVYLVGFLYSNGDQKTFKIIKQ